MESLIFILMLAAIAGFAIWAHYQAARRRAELSAWAARHGWHWSAGRDSSFDNRYAFFSCLTKGDNRFAENIIEGVDRDRPFRAFDYHYETHSTDSKGRRQTHHHHFSAVILTTDGPLKPLSIREETWLDKVGEFFGLDDIDFESAEFSRAFHVKSPDRRWAFDVLNQRTMEFLLAAPRFAIEFGGVFAIVYRDRRFSVGDFEAALGVAAGLLECIPRAVLEELKGTSP